MAKTPDEAIAELRDQVYAARQLPLSKNNKRIYPGAKVRQNGKDYCVVCIRRERKQARIDQRIVIERNGVQEISKPREVELLT